MVGLSRTILFKLLIFFTDNSINNLPNVFSLYCTLESRTYRFIEGCRYLHLMLDGVNNYLNIPGITQFAFCKNVILRYFRLLAQVSHPVSKHKAVLSANFGKTCDYASRFELNFLLSIRILFKASIPNFTCVFEDRSDKSQINV